MVYPLVSLIVIILSSSEFYLRYGLCFEKIIFGQLGMITLLGVGGMVGFQRLVLDQSNSSKHQHFYGLFPKKEMFIEELMWNLELFRVWLSEDIIERITSILPPHPLAGSDKVAWMGTSLGSQRVQVFLWLALKQWLLTQVKRLKHRVGSDARCSICCYELEDVLHVIRDCGTAKDVWSRIILPQKEAYFFSGCSVAGEVLRDHNGKWITGFNRRLGKCSIFEVELWGILDVCRWYKEDNMIEYWCKQTTWKLLGLSRNLCRSGQIQL
ncbi:hypothetical protein Golax_021662 [Gossypium laxum]|uniref:Reverse transcriptase zinc-binding domain-containing protein n=1 Tax=Gossypium laxum TaxID=34288 RepID=A0A7J9AM14_9ROSI|nr:hypothetical protein [Gossypium laxum]